MTRLRRLVGVTLLGTLWLAVPGAAQTGQNIVDDVGSSVFFADGTFRDGFQTSVAVMSLSDEIQDVEFLFSISSVGRQAVGVPPLRFALPPRSRVVHSVNQHLSSNKVPPPVDFSLRINGEKDLIAERTVYFSSELLGGVQGAASSLGPRALAEDHYFPDGSVRPGFQTYYAFFHPRERGGDDDAAKVTLRFNAIDAAGRVVDVKEQSFDLSSGSRTTRDLAELLREAGAVNVADAGMRVESSEPIAVERALYTRASIGGGVAGGTIAGGTISAGATEGATRWYFPEGFTGPGFTELITIQNLAGGDAGATLRFTAIGPDGAQAAVPELRVTVPGRSRLTTDVTEHLNRNAVEGRNVSVLLDSSDDVVAERTIFFSGQRAGNVQGVSVTLGVQFLRREHYFPSGSVGPGSEYRLSLFNPGDAKALVEVSFFANGSDGTPVSVPGLTLDVPANGRLTQSLNDHFLQSGVRDRVDVGTRLFSDVQIAVERTQFVSDGPNGAQGGSVTASFGKKEREPVPRGLLLAGVIVMAASVVLAVLIFTAAGRREEDEVAPAEAAA